MTFDASWQAAIDAIVASYMRLHGRGRFRMRNARPDSPTPFLVDLTLPDGRAYQGGMRRHVTDGEEWYEGFLDADSMSTALRDEELNADGALPADAPPRFNLWPRQLKINPAPVAQSGKTRSEFVGRLWVSASDGAPGGQLFTVVANRGHLVVMKGHVVRYRPRR